MKHVSLGSIILDAKKFIVMQDEIVHLASTRMHTNTRVDAHTHTHTHTRAHTHTHTHTHRVVKTNVQNERKL
jgi:hypothetical protein